MAGRDGVDVLGGRVERQVAAGAPGGVDHPFQQVMRPLGTVMADDGVERFHPLACFGGVDVLMEDIVELIHENLRGAFGTMPDGVPAPAIRSRINT